MSAGREELMEVGWLNYVMVFFCQQDDLWRRVVADHVPGRGWGCAVAEDAKAVSRFCCFLGLADYKCDRLT
jgi:hypothetical protein